MKKRAMIIVIISIICSVASECMYQLKILNKCKKGII